MDKLAYRPVSVPQTCAWCDNDATHEAVRSDGNMTTIIPCCDDSKCVLASSFLSQPRPPRIAV